MGSKRKTYGDLFDLLTGLGFERKVLDDQRVAYFHKPSDWLFVLHNRSPETTARDRDVNHVRYQLHWRGLMEQEDFDAWFAQLADSKS